MKRYLTAILAADIVGYSRLMEADEAGTIARQKRHLAECIRPAISAHDGRVIKLMGDGILIEFPSVVEAVACAVSIQTEMRTREADVVEDARILYRVGINLGDVFKEAGDVFGDGVNIAARLEEMADPGGICISGTAYDHLKSNIPVTYQPLGEITVKNISQPVRVYKVLLGQPVAGAPRGRAKAFLGIGVLLLALAVGGWLWQSNALLSRNDPPPAPTGPVADASLPAPMDSRPSIAVLPFDNFSGGEDQDFFSDGITEDLITDLSQVSGLFVIARNTVFAYKDRAVNVKDVARELKVRYVLEGSVRRSGDTVRINAQLIDASSGGHIWAERFDRDLADVFAVQDDVVKKIVEALEITLNTDERKRLDRNQRVDPDAYVLLLRGLEQFRRFTSETNLIARDYFRQSLEIDPTFALAQADLALTYGIEAEQFWSDHPVEAGKQARDLGLAALELDPDIAQVYFGLSVAHRTLGEIDESIRVSRRAIELDPNYADGYATLAISLAYAGFKDEALDAIDRAITLNPIRAFYYVWVEGVVHYVRGDFARAAELFESVVFANPEFTIGHRMLAATYVELGRLDDAEWSAQEVLATAPNFTVDLDSQVTHFTDPKVKAAYVAALRSAGLP